MTDPAEVTCPGRCCAVFPLRATTVAERKVVPLDWSKVADGEYIRDMIVPLTEDEARARWSALGFGDLPWTGAELAAGGQTFHTCRHWDTETRLCTAYEARPAMCRDYPYTGECQRCGYPADPKVAARYEHPQRWTWDGWRWDRRGAGYRRAAEHAASGWPGDATDWQPGTGWSWDGEFLRPVAPAGPADQCWSPRRRRWEQAATVDAPAPAALP